MGLLDSLTQDLSNFFDNSKAIYDQSTGTAPSVPQVSGLLSSDSLMPQQVRQEQMSSPIETGVGIGGLLDTGYHMYKDITDPNTHGLDKAINTDEDLTKGLGMTEAGVVANTLVPGAGLVLGAGDLAYEGIAAGGNYLQHNLGFKGLLR